MALGFTTGLQPAVSIPSVRRLLIFATLGTLVLALAPGAQAAERVDLRQYLAVDTAPLSLVGGKGTAKIVRRGGAVLGSVREGRIVITAPRGRRPGASISGCNSRRRPSTRTIVCAGKGLYFSTRSDRKVSLRGSGVDVSAVMRGSLSLKGTAGWYSIGGVSSGSWPRILRTWRVGG